MWRRVHRCLLAASWRPRQGSAWRALPESEGARACGAVSHAPRVARAPTHLLASCARGCCECHSSLSVFFSPSWGQMRGSARKGPTQPSNIPPAATCTSLPRTLTLQRPLWQPSPQPPPWQAAGIAPTHMAAYDYAAQEEDEITLVTRRPMRTCRTRTHAARQPAAPSLLHLATPWLLCAWHCRAPLSVHTPRARCLRVAHTWHGGLCL